MDDLWWIGQVVFFAGAAMIASAFVPFPSAQTGMTSEKAARKILRQPWLLAYGIVICLIGFCVEWAGRMMGRS
jgi:hypothetical protein